MKPLARIGQATVDVLEVLLDSGRSRWGLEIIKLTGRPSGSVYPLLRRLEDAGWVVSQWDSTQRHGPRRRLYELNPDGTGLTAVAFRVALATRKGHAMVPLGPLALALHLIGGEHARRRAFVLTLTFGLLLIMGIGLLLAT